MDKFAMHHAAEYGDLKTVRQLVEDGMSVNSRNNKGQTPLHVAAACGQYNAVQLLISSKCDINAVDDSGSTPVLTAALSEQKDVTDLLLHHGLEVNRANHNDFSLLHCASRNGWADTVQHILSVEKGVDLNATTRGEYTPLMVAAMTNRGDCAEILLRAGADPNRTDVYEWTALHYAVDRGYKKVVQVLLGAEGLDLNPQDNHGQTPLHLACESGYRGVLKEMLEAGADYTIIDNIGETALSVGITEMKLTLEEIRLFVQQGQFFQEKEYESIFLNSVLKESVLKDASLCTQSVVNKFHRQSLSALKSISYFAEHLPNINNFKLNAREIEEVEEMVKCEIGKNNFFNVFKVHPKSLKALCILTLITD